MGKINIEVEFGESAGKVWTALNSKGDKSATELAKETKLKPNDVYIALGWLSREGKITAIKKKTGITYGLSEI
ncbi:MAG: winged helix-turn-helix domain-containing protein [archaeon]